MWILVLVLFSVVVALLSYLDMRKPKNYPPGNFPELLHQTPSEINHELVQSFRSEVVADFGKRPDREFAP